MYQSRAPRVANAVSEYAPKGHRSNVTLRIGDVWQTSDPRRFTWFSIVAVGITHVGVCYASGREARIPRASFYVTGTRGYTRVS